MSEVPVSIIVTVILVWVLSLILVYTYGFYLGVKAVEDRT